MCKDTDWLPSKRGEQLAMADNWLFVIKTRYKDWNIPEEVTVNLESCFRSADTALGSLHLSDAQCKEAFSALIILMCDIKDRYLKKPPLTDSDYISIGLNSIINREQ